MADTDNPDSNHTNSNGTISNEINSSMESIKNYSEMYEKLLSDTNIMKSNYVEQLEVAYKKLDLANKEKESMVMKYATAQKDVLDLHKEKKQLQNLISNLNKDKDTLRNSIKSLTDEKRQVIGILNKKIEEQVQKGHEYDKLNNAFKALETKIKWRDHKIETEIEAHKETKRLLESRNHSYSSTTTAESGTQTMEEQINLEQVLQEQKALLIMAKQKHSELNRRCATLSEELQSLRSERQTYITNNSSMKISIDKLENDKKRNLETIQTLTKSLDDLKSEKINYLKEKEKCEELTKEVTRVKDNLNQYETNWELLEREIKEKNVTVTQCREKESELLEFTQKLSDRNAALQNQLSIVTEKIPELEQMSSEQSTKIASLSEELESIRKEKLKVEQFSELEISRLNGNLEEQKTDRNKLETSVSDLQNELSVQKKKFQKSLKDANKEIVKLTRKLEILESNESKQTEKADLDLDECAATSRLASEDHSRTSSTTSLNVVGQKSSPDYQRETPDQATSMLDPIVVDKLWEIKSGSLKKDEKIQFLEEHIAQLVSELQKKNKLISNYFLKHETGVLSSNASDSVKLPQSNLALRKKQTEIIKKGGIMASVYGSTPKDTAITLDLSLEINRKLQAILEDTLLKNITLKENLNTLAAEIATLTLQKSPH